jgi:hypothetical protein
MTRKQLEHVLFCLLKFKQPNEHVNEAIAYVERDIALRKQQSKEQRDSRRESFWPESYV